jgi:hypothetical protein
MMQHYPYPMGILQGWHFGELSSLSFHFSNSRLYLSDDVIESAQDETTGNKFNEGNRDAEDESEVDNVDVDVDDVEHEPNDSEPQQLLEITEQPSSDSVRVNSPNRNESS